MTELQVAAVVGVTLVAFAAYAWLLPWTVRAIALWCVSLAAILWLQVQPGLTPHLIAIGIALIWASALVWPQLPPFWAWGTAAERCCHDGMHRVSKAAREAYLAGRLSEILGELVADVEALEPPAGPWRAARAAQLLDLRARPPQVGVGAATDRLVSWPWRVALDHRIVRLRVRLDDAVRRRRGRGLDRPGWDDLSSDQRYDLFFLRVLTARFSALQQSAGGLVAASGEAAALISLGREVEPPDVRWASVRDLVVERLNLELLAAEIGLDANETARLEAVAGASVSRWAELEASTFGTATTTA